MLSAVLRRVLLLVAALLVLAGCRLDVAVTVDVADDGTGTVTVEATADAELLARVPGVLDDLAFDDAISTGWTVDGPTETEGGGAVLRLTKPFDDPAEATAVLAELNGPAGPLHGLTLVQDRRFAVVTTSFTGEVRLDGGVNAFADEALVAVAGGAPFADLADPAATADGLGVTLTLKAPGTATVVTGETTDAGIEWDPPMDGSSTEVRAVLEQRDATAERARSIESASRVAVVVWLVAVALLAVVVVILLVLRGRRRGRPRISGHRPGGLPPTPRPPA
jgi:hypothetical protein